MGKVSVKKRTMKGRKKGPCIPKESTDKDVPNAGEANTDGEEEGSDDERRRQKLLESISSLGSKKKKKLFERSEASAQMSEFTVIAEGEGVKVNMSDLIKSLDQVPNVSVKAKKQLKNLQQSRKAITCPLSKEESERIQRDVAFQKAATEVSNWQSLIQQNQRSEQLIFPLNQEPFGPKPLETLAAGWKAQTPLEQEVFSLLSANKQPINDPRLTRSEEASMTATTLLEAKMRRAELQKTRVLQSYYEAKARREKKIKSKKYHKVVNKAKRKDFMKSFEELVKKDPASALEQMDKMELARMQERMSLKHQNSGKWAMSKAIMGKYDKEARKAMQQQLEINKDLTQKRVPSLNDEEEKAEDTEIVPDFVNEAVQGADPSNPWMRGKLYEDPADKEMHDVQAEIATAVNAEEEEENEVVETEEESLLREFDTRRKIRRAGEDVQVGFGDAAGEAGALEQEDAQRLEFTQLYKEKVRVCQEAEVNGNQTDTSAQLQEGLLRIQTLEDIDLLGEVDLVADKAPDEPQKSLEGPDQLPDTNKAQKTRKRKKGIQLKEVMTKDTHVVQIPLAPTATSTEDSEETCGQMGLIKEAFAGDDVISDFLKAKKKQEDEGKPKVVSLALPGWGEWGGEDLKVSRRKRKKFTIKTKPPPPRKDRNHLNVIISEKRNSAISLHQVNSQPFPFNSLAQFESTLCTPVGRTWNTEQTVKKLTKPKVITRLGSFIEPMAKEQLMKVKRRSRNYVMKK
uniref:U3 small nucleolar RNA-associated protein 14 homolog A n=1 Tax=Doryrhamphus excisus TaxID=161450 RepID=UPI0025AE41B0|nr:U3 small nucleolar RNA-associated protein 14 homolog A [Doryrhamphus excisus]